MYYQYKINTSIEETWRIVSHPKIFYEIISKDLIYDIKDGQIDLNSPVELFNKYGNSENIIPFITLDVQSMMISFF